MALQWNAFHLLGRLSGLRSDHAHLKALLDVCYTQSLLMIGEDEPNDDEETLIGLFRLGNSLLEDLETNLTEVQEIADAGVRETRTAGKEGE